MIAANYRKHPEAMALQLVLAFGHALVWALPRPTTRTLRAIRSARAAAFKLAGRIAYPVAKVKPQYARDADRRARKLVDLVKRACLRLQFEEPKPLKGFAAHLARCDENFNRYTFNITA